MRQADLRDSGRSNIPARDKRPAYGGYPRSEISGQPDQNATPGPSHPRRADRDTRHRRISDHESNHSRIRNRNSRPLSRERRDHQGNVPSDPDDEGSSDSMYKGSTRSTTTESEITTSQSKEGRQNSRSQKNRDKHRSKTH